jgi:hypothetical protein
MAKCPIMKGFYAAALILSPVTCRKVKIKTAGEPNWRMALTARSSSYSEQELLKV